MQMATVKLQMANGREVYFRAPRQEISRLVLSRHRCEPGTGTHTITTEKEVPITVNLLEIEQIHIL